MGVIVLRWANGGRASTVVNGGGTLLDVGELGFGGVADGRLLVEEVCATITRGRSILTQSASSLGVNGFDSLLGFGM